MSSELFLSEWAPSVVEENPLRKTIDINGDLSGVGSQYDLVIKICWRHFGGKVWAGHFRGNADAVLRRT